jgi:hypothetical protein
MTKLLTATAIIGAVSLFAVEANAWTRSRAVVGPRGVSTFHGSGSCANGSCNRSVTRTGPYGGTMNRNGSVSCSGGTCSGTRTTTGPYGNTVTRQGTVTR